MEFKIKTPALLSGGLDLLVRHTPPRDVGGIFAAVGDSIYN